MVGGLDAYHIDTGFLNHFNGGIHAEMGAQEAEGVVAVDLGDYRVIWVRVGEAEESRTPCRIRAKYLQPESASVFQSRSSEEVARRTSYARERILLCCLNILEWEEKNPN